MYLAYVVLDLTTRQIAKAFRRDHSTVSHACRLIEEAREDPNIDRTMDWLETLLRRSAGMAA
jgi:chromosomal replication initiation ATPase DnaA